MSVQVLSVKKGINIEIVSIIWMVIEAIVAIGAGVVAHSLVLTAFGADSVIELIAGGVLLWRLYVESIGSSLKRIQRAERVASWIVGIALMALAVYIVIFAIYDLWAHTSSQFSLAGMALAVASSVVMPYIARSKKVIGKQMGSKALQADGSCSFVCAYMSWTMLGGLMLTSIFGWWWLNALAGLALVYFVGKEGIESVQVARGVKDDCGCCHV